jgi:hypothetical protein
MGAGTEIPNRIPDTKGISSLISGNLSHFII